MKKLLLLIPLTFFPVPAHAITWGEFWAPFTPERVYVVPEHRYRPHVRPYVRPVCEVQRERVEWVEGYYFNRWNYRPGRWERWIETEYVPC